MGVYFSVCPPPCTGGAKYAQITRWGKNAYFIMRGVPHHYNKFCLGKKCQARRGGGKNMDLKFNIHPCKHNHKLLKVDRYKCIGCNKRGGGLGLGSSSYYIFLPNQLSSRLLSVYKP